MLTNGLGDEENLCFDHCGLGPQKQVSVQGKTAPSFCFRLESSIPLFAYTISLKKK